MKKFLILAILAIGVLGLFFESINTLITSNIATNLLIPAFLIYFTYVFVNNSIEKFKHENNKELEREIFIRDVTAKEKNELLKGWTSLIMDKSLMTDSDPQKLIKTFEELHLKTAMYGGQRLVILVSLFQSHNVAVSTLAESQKAEHNMYKTIMYMGVIASEMKEEFTNIKVSPLTMIKMKFNDFQAIESLLKQIENEIEKEYEEYLINLKKS